MSITNGGGGDSSRVVSTVGRNGLPWWAWTGIILFVLIVVVGIAAALAVPGLVRARISGNEVSAIGYLRAVSGAEALAQSINRGYGLPIQCLENPQSCPPAVSETPLLVPMRGDAYGTLFTVAAAPSPEEIAASGASPRSIKAWTLVAVPRQPGQTGIRVFCVDGSGSISFTPDSTNLPDVSGGKCSNTAPLQ
ncbi:MAG: hypothetical protein NTY02_16895 [Acidobacteria bacterium]|nr:hypothetical protein [Acidobacteriota bacterium]